jgi:hypothetical protein
MYEKKKESKPKKKMDLGLEKLSEKSKNVEKRMKEICDESKK